MATAINILLMGRSGAGKSSLANYLYGKKLFEVGDGYPVTQFDSPWKMASIPNRKENFSINIYDSPGLEPDNYKIWEDNINTNMRNRKEPEKWIHGAFYVINAASDRFEPIELEIIKTFPHKYYFPISIALTNCDSATPNSIEELRKTISTDIPNSKIVNVCSISRKKRNGEIIQTFGRDDLLTDHAKNVAYYFTQRMGCTIFGTIIPDTLYKVFGDVLYDIEHSDFGIIDIIKNGEDAFDFLNDILEKPRHQLEEEIDKQMEYICSAEDYLSNISGGKNYLPDFSNIFDEIDFDNSMHKVAPLLRDIENCFQSDSIFDKFCGVVKAGYGILTAKKQVMTVVRNMRNLLLDKCSEKNSVCVERLKYPEKYIDNDEWKYEW